MTIEFNGKSVVETKNILRVRYPGVNVQTLPEDSMVTTRMSEGITILFKQLDPLQNPEVSPNYLQIVTKVTIPASLATQANDVYTLAPSGTPGDSDLNKYCVPLQTGEVDGPCSSDYKGYGYDASKKECVLVRCDHTFGARFQTKKDCDTTCKDLIDAPVTQTYTNPSPPPVFLWVPNVCIFVSAEAWMTAPGGTLRMMSLPPNGQPILTEQYSEDAYDAMFRIEKSGKVVSLTGRTLRFMDSENPTWEFRPYMARDLGQLAFTMRQKDRLLASQNTLQQVTATAADNTSIKTVWFIIPIGQM